MNKLTYKRRQEVAKEISAAAKRCLAHNLSVFKGDKDLIAMARGDSRDMREVAKCLRTEGVESALRKAWSMDTAARDQIPGSVWEALSGE